MQSISILYLLSWYSNWDREHLFSIETLYQYKKRNTRCNKMHTHKNIYEYKICVPIQLLSHIIWNGKTMKTGISNKKLSMLLFPTFFVVEFKMIAGFNLFIFFFFKSPAYKCLVLFLVGRLATSNAKLKPKIANHKFKKWISQYLCQYRSFNFHFVL